MSKTLSMDLRLRGLAAVDAGMSRRAAAGRFGVSASSVIRRDAQRRTTGSFEPKRRGGEARSRRIEARRADVMAAFEEERGQTHAEPRARPAERGVAASSSALPRFFRRLGLTRKKIRARGRAGARGRPELAAPGSRRSPISIPAGSRSSSRSSTRPGRRRTWPAPTARTHGRRRRGERLRMGFPHGHRKSTTLIAGLRLDGMVAPMARDGPVDGDWFEACVAKAPAPTLCPGDIVIMDNLSSRKRASVGASIEARGARLAFLPPYSPDFNPIGMAFAKLKALLRKAAERTVDGLWNAIGRLVDVFAPQECANCLAAAGHDAD